MAEKTFTPGATTGQRFASVWDALPQDLPDSAPLTSEALTEQAMFDAAQYLAAQHGKELKRTTTGYRVSWPGFTRHCVELQDAADFVRSAHKTTTTDSKRPHGQGEQP